ncbi:MAG: hypothetical protein H7836_15850 [Magnetococcus sp. YQC-3]
MCSLSLLALPAVAMAADPGAAAEQRAGGRDLLAQQIRVDRSDLKMEGEIVLRTLKPLTGELRLRKARGEPRQIFAALIRLVPGFKSGFDSFFDQVDVHDLELNGLLISVTQEGYRFSLERAAIPEGKLERVTGQFDLQKNWQVESGALSLTQLPLLPTRPKPPLPVSYRKLTASGSGQETLYLEVEKVRLGHLAFVTDSSGVLGEYLRAMGFAKGVQSSPILCDHFAATLVTDAKQMVTQSLSLRSPTANSSGKASLPWQPEPRKLHLEMEVTSSKQPVRQFKTVIPLARR